MTGNIWFFGTGHFAAKCLQAISKDVPISLVVTQPPTRAGRGLKLRPSAVEETAKACKLKLSCSEAVNKDESLISTLKAENPDVILVIDFGQWVGEPWLSTPKFGCINIHPSLLPKYRGAAPLQRALMDGCTTTGVTLFRLAPKMDAGAIWLSAQSEIGENEQFPQLRDRLAELGSKMFCDNLAALLAGGATFKEQDEALATYAKKIQKSECLLNPELPAQKLHGIVRGLAPSPGAYFMYNGKRIKVLESRTAAEKGETGKPFISNGKVLFAAADASLELITVQPEGKKAMRAQDWARGALRM